jgi:periplasmic copper chaperone A
LPDGGDFSPRPGNLTCIAAAKGRNSVRNFRKRPQPMTIRARLAACLLAFAAMTAAAIAQDHPDGLHIHDAYARVQGGAGGSGAVFFMVHNNTETDDRLIGAKTDVAERAELHTHAEDANGMMTMGEIEGGIPLAAGDFIELARGGDHVMLMGLTGALTDGDTITLTLTFEVAHFRCPSTMNASRARAGTTTGQCTRTA